MSEILRYIMKIVCGNDHLNVQVRRAEGNKETVTIPLLLNAMCLKAGVYHLNSYENRKQKKFSPRGPWTKI